MTANSIPRPGLLRFVHLSPVLLLAGVGCATIHSIDRTGVRTVSLAEFQADMAAQGEHAALPRRGVILKLDRGTTVPLKVDVHTSFGSIEPGVNKVRLERDLYMFLAPATASLSPDGERWADLGDWRAVRKLFGGQGGFLSIGVGMSKEEGPFMNIVIGQGHR